MIVEVNFQGQFNLAHIFFGVFQLREARASVYARRTLTIIRFCSFVCLGVQSSNGVHATFENTPLKSFFFDFY